MPRMRGESPKEYAGRKLADSLQISATKIKFEAVVIGPICTCLAFAYPHEAIQHFKALSNIEYSDWEAWVNSGKESFYWPGWGMLGSEIKSRRMEC